jgi:hypothetical protein
MTCACPLAGPISIIWIRDKKDDWSSLARIVVWRVHCQVTREGILTPRILQPLRSWGFLLLVVGSLALPALSQQITEPPDAPSFNKKLFIAELSTYTAMNVLDGITTVQNVQKGYIEGNFPAGSSYLLGHRPSAARYAVTMGLIEVGVSVVSYRLQHSRTKWLRVVGHGLMIQAAYGHTDGSIRNIRLMQSQ